MAEFLPSSNSTHHPSPSSASVNLVLQTQWLELFHYLSTLSWTDIQNAVLWNVLMVVAAGLLSSCVAFVFAQSIEGRGEIFVFSF